MEERLFKEEKVFCSKKKECWAGRNNSCPRLMKWGWPEEAYGIWRVGSVRARGRQELSAGKTKEACSPAKRGGGKGGQGEREGKWKGELKPDCAVE